MPPLHACYAPCSGQSCCCIGPYVPSGSEWKFDLLLSPDCTMQKRYPIPDSKVVSSFAATLGDYLSRTPAYTLVAAAVFERWNVVHALVAAKTELSSAGPVDLDSFPITSVAKLLTGKTAEDNACVLLAIIALHKNFTALRYVIEHRNELQLSTVALTAVPALQMELDLPDTAFWFLTNIPYSETDFSDACSQLEKASLFKNRLDLIPIIHGLMQDREVYSKKLLIIFALNPRDMSLRDSTANLSSKEAMEKRYPKADMDIVSSFASSVLPMDSNDLAYVLLITASWRLWRIFHTLLAMGISPLNAHLSDFQYKNKDKFLTLQCNKSSYLSNVLLILVAAGGDISLMSYVLSLQHQIGYSRAVFCWLPYSAMLHGSHVLANWLLLNLPFEIKEYIDAIKLLALHSLQGHMFDEFLAYINDVLRRCPEFVLEDFVRQCFVQNIQNKQILKFLLTDSRLPLDVFTAVAKEHLPHFAGMQDHLTSKFITDALEEFKKK